MKIQCGFCKQFVETGKHSEGLCPNCHAALFDHSAWPMWMIGNPKQIHYSSNGVNGDSIRIADSAEDPSWTVNALAVTLFTSWQFYMLLASMLFCGGLVYLKGWNIFTFLTVLELGILPLWYFCMSIPVLHEKYTLRREQESKRDTKWRCKFALPETSSWLWLSSSFLAKLDNNKFLYVYADEVDANDSCIAAKNMSYFITVGKNTDEEAEILVHSVNELEELEEVEVVVHKEDELEELVVVDPMEKAAFELKQISHNTMIVKNAVVAGLRFFLFEMISLAIGLIALSVCFNVSRLHEPGIEVLLFLASGIVSLIGFVRLIFDVCNIVSKDNCFREQTMKSH